jgi:acyl-CoA thioester hydrolase
MYINETQLRVQYFDTDQMGVVHHSNYIRYFEIGRTDSMRQIGLAYKTMEESGVSMPIAHVEVRYLHPAFYDDILTVKTYIKSLPAARIRFFYEIYNVSGTMLADGSTTLAFININTGRPQRAPENMIETLSKFINND